ncbi:MAG: DJ-1/PfpI family protein, partial [Mesorhizobium sp.]
MIVSIPVYDEVDLLGVSGPQEVLKLVPDLEVRLVGGSVDTSVVTRDGFRFLATHSYDDNTQVDVLWVPGGNPNAMAPIMNRGGDGHYLDYIVRTAENARWVCSVCE